MIGPLVLKEEERSEDEGGDNECKESDANEAPKIEKTLMEQGTETGRRVGLIAEESAGDEEEVEQQIERD